jgi:Bacterial regulatory helix-turn-helix protein, lysR family
MAERADFDKIELHLIRVLQTLITERSVSRAAMRLRSTQPAVSAQLKRLRALTGDPLLVRAGNGSSRRIACCKTPTDCSARANACRTSFRRQAR